MPGMNLRTRFCLGILTLVALVCAWPRGNFGADPGPEMEKKNLAAGKELFTREWLPGDRRSHAGDGLGPVFNARSCVACHHQGGVGGAGPKESNVTLVSAFVTMDGSMPKPNPAKATKQPDRAKLAKIHPNLRTESSF